MSKTKANLPSREGFQWNAVVRGIAWSLVITIFLGISISLLLQYTPLSEKLLSNLSIFIFFISMFLGATIGARFAGCKGLQHGLIISLSYWLLMLVITLVWSPESITISHLLKRFAFALLSGLAGGIIGIGFSAK